jgi:hypothetical protein
VLGPVEILARELTDSSRKPFAQPSLIVSSGVAISAESRMVKELDLFETNQGCGLSALSQGKHPKRT